MTGRFPELHPLSISRFMLESAQDSKVNDMTPMKLLKLVYIAHGWHLGILDEPLLTEQAQAWQYGPVVPSVYHEFKRFYRNPVPFSEIELLPKANLDPTQGRVLVMVWGAYSHFSGIQLSEMTHQEGTPWWKTWNQFGGRERKGVPIDNMLIRDHYRSRFAGVRHASA